MLQILFQHPEFMIPILILLSFSIICQISMGVLCHKLIRETENMSATNNKSLQQLKLKFSSCCQLHEGISNISIFVDKYMNKLKVHGFSVSTLKHLSGQLVLLSILISGIGACKGIIDGESIIYIIPYYIISFLGLYCYFAISSLVDISGKVQMLRTNLIDYLENHLVNRIEQTNLDMKLVMGENAAQTREKERDAKPAAVDRQSPEPEENTLTHKEAQELESLLKEFLA